jgi:hypothetical protein
MTNDHVSTIETPQIILTTVGVSLLRVCSALPDAERPVSREAMTEVLQNTSTVAPSAPMQRTLEELARYLSLHPELLLRSAEFDTLALFRRRMVSTNDPRQWYLPRVRYAFIGSDTYVGHWMLARFRDFFGSHHPNVPIGPDILVRGLQVRSATGLDTALREMQFVLDRATRPYPHYQVLLCISGGYKFISGWMQSYAVQRGFAAIYTYEDSNELIMAQPQIPGDFPPRLLFI